MSRILLLFLIGAGVLFHLTFRDSFQTLAVVYYALPIPGLFLFTVVYLCISLKNRFHRFTSVLFFSGLAYWNFLAPSGYTKIPPYQPTLTFWNMDWGSIEASSFIDFINENDSEIYTFVEFHEGLQEAVQGRRIPRETPGYKALLLGRGVAVIFKEGLEFQALERRESRHYCFTKVRIGRRVLCIVDIASDPRLDRGQALEILNEFSRGCDLVCGDFNTPYGSVHLDRLRSEFTSGNTDQFSGRETWPSPFALLALDHIFVKPSWTVVSYGRIGQWATDHFPVAVKLGSELPK